MTTNNAVNVGLSGSTGSVHFVGSTSPTFVTPTLGAATATSVTFSPTTGGIVGTATNDNAGSGFVGQVVSSVVAYASSISLSNGVDANITSISLSAGDWDIYGNANFAISGIAACYVWISATSATIPDASLFSQVTNASAVGVGINAPFFRASLSTTTTIYLSVDASFGSGTVTACGGISARRAR